MSAAVDHGGMDDRRLGAAVRARRHQRGWRLVDLASAAGVGAGVCGLLERGQVVRLSVRTARAIVEAVGLPLGAAGGRDYISPSKGSCGIRSGLSFR